MYRKHQTEMEKQTFLSRIANLPISRDVLDQVTKFYETAQAKPLVGTGIRFGENGWKLASTVVLPIVHKLPVDKVDAFACHRLDDLEHWVPAVKEKHAGELWADTKSASYNVITWPINSARAVRDKGVATLRTTIHSRTPVKEPVEVVDRESVIDKSKKLASMLIDPIVQTTKTVTEGGVTKLKAIQEAVADRHADLLTMVDSSLTSLHMEHMKINDSIVKYLDPSTKIEFEQAARRKLGSVDYRKLSAVDRHTQMLRRMVTQEWDFAYYTYSNSNLMQAALIHKVQPVYSFAYDLVSPTLTTLSTLATNAAHSTTETYHWFTTNTLPGRFANYWVQLSWKGAQGTHDVTLLVFDNVCLKLWSVDLKPFLTKVPAHISTVFRPRSSKLSCQKETKAESSSDEDGEKYEEGDEEDHQM